MFRRRLDAAAVADADIPLPSARPPVTDQQAQAMRLEPVPDLPAPPAQTRLDAGPLLRLVGGGLALLALAAGVGVVVAWRSRPTHAR